MQPEMVTTSDTHILVIPEALRANRELAGLTIAGLASSAEVAGERLWRAERSPPIRLHPDEYARILGALQASGAGVRLIEMRANPEPAPHRETSWRSARCAGTTKAGQPCRARAMQRGLCWQHQDQGDETMAKSDDRIAALESKMTTLAGSLLAMERQIATLTHDRAKAAPDLESICASIGDCRDRLEALTIRVEQSDLARRRSALGSADKARLLDAVSSLLAGIGRL
jgi:hypothetical protein